MIINSPAKIKKNRKLKFFFRASQDVKERFLVISD